MREGGGRHLELSFRCHLLQAAFPDSHSPRGESEGSRGGSRKRVDTEDGPRSSRFRVSPGTFSTCPTRRTEPLPLPHLHRWASPRHLPARPSRSLLMGRHQGAVPLRPPATCPQPVGFRGSAQASCSTGWEGGRRAGEGRPAWPNHAGLGVGGREVRRAESGTVGPSIQPS